LSPVWKLEKAHNPKVAGSNPAPATIIHGISMTYKAIMDNGGDISNNFLTEFSKVAQRPISVKNQSVDNYQISFWKKSENQIFWKK